MSTDTTRLGHEAWADIERRSARACVVYADHRLPPGCSPARGRIGIERTAGAGRALLVDRAVQYTGEDPDVADWVRSGAREFEGVRELRLWLAAVLGTADDGDGLVVDASPASRPRRVEELVDVAAVPVAPAPRPRLSAVELAGRLREEVVGQDLAVGAVAAHVARHVAKTAPRRPLTMLFSGPTGVGKTLLAQTLAETLGRFSGGRWGFLRLDANELSEPHTVARLVGAPPGYRGHGDGGDLASILASGPRQLVLVDEIDKAHPAVLRVLMNLMDAGRLAGLSGSGECDARSAILVFTTNAPVAPSEGAVLLGGAAGGRRSLVAGGVPPEIAARITALVSFAPLGLDGRIRVAVLALRRVAESYGVRLSGIAPGLVGRLLREHPDDGFGVRTLEYAIERWLGATFAEATARGDVAGELVDGDPPQLVVEAAADPTPDGTAPVPDTPEEPAV